MKHEELKARLDRIEEKLDRYIELSAKSSADMKWVKGYIKMSVGAILSVSVGLIKLFLGTHH